MSATLPSGRNYLSCAPHGDSIYCFGGIDDSTYLNQIVRYNIISNTITVMSATLPSGRTGLSCAPHGDSIYCFGGYDGSRLNQIVRYVRKFSFPEPTIFLGNEEIGIVITIYSPLNQTYFYVNNFEFKFKVEHLFEQTFELKAFLDGQIIYQNNSYLSGETTTLLLNLTQDKTYNFTIWANANNVIRTQSVIFTIKAFEFVNVSYNSVVYETSNQSFAITFRINFDLVENITSALVWNGTNQQYQEQTRNSTHLTNKVYFDIPLVQANNTQISFFFTNTIHYKNGTQATFNTNNYQQNITFAYWIDSITSEKNNYIEFEDTLIKLYVIDKIGKATLSANITFIYNTTYKITKELHSYITSQHLKIFNSSFDVLESFLDNETRSYFANLTVSYQGNSRIMNSPVQNLTVYKIILTNCSVYTTRALTFYVRDEETDNPIQNATIEVTFDVWKTGEIKRNYAWKFYLENRNNQSVCIYPSWAEYTINSMIQYYKAGYKDRTYYIFTKINNSTTGVNLYLLSETSGNVIIVYVVNEDGNKISDAIVKIQRYYVGSNSYKTVAQVKTDHEGKGVTFLKVNEIYYRFIIERNFTVLRETQPTIITCMSGGCPPYPVTLSVSEQKPPKYFQYLGKIAYACILNEDTNILKCTVDDTSQLMQKARLLVEKKGALKFDTLCDNYCESSACTLVCDLGNRTNNLYRYQLFAYIPEQIVLEQKILDYLTGIIFWGSQGLLIGFVLVSTLFFVGIWNPVVSLLFAFLGIIVGYILGIIPVSVYSLIGLALALVILIYKMRV